MDAEPGQAFDARWLEQLAGVLGSRRAGKARILDLYLERRLERRLLRTPDRIEEIEVRDEGYALRLRTGLGTVLEAANGLDRTALAVGFSGLVPARLLPARPAGGVPPAVPAGWTRWAEAAAARLGPGRVEVRLVARTAAVVRPGQWTLVATPPLVRIAAGGATLLAVWDHPQLDGWLATLGESPARTGWLPEPGTRRPVVFAGGSGGVLLHELVGHMAESDLVAAGLSPLADRAGERIAPAALTVVDDPLRFDLPGAFDRDDEGTPASPRTLIASGILSGWLCDGEGARALGCEPGRGRRAGWPHPPVARMSNLVTAAGGHDPAEIEAGVGHGLVVTRAGAAMVDPGEDRVVMRIEAGWELLHGRRRRPLAPCHLVGRATGALAGILPEIGNDPTPDWRTGWCHKDGHTLPTGAVTPTLVVEGLEVL